MPKTQTATTPTAEIPGRRKPGPKPGSVRRKMAASAISRTGNNALREVFGQFSQRIYGNYGNSEGLQQVVGEINAFVGQLQALCTAAQAMNNNWQGTGNASRSLSAHA